ncbi:MAG: VOC family protein [Chloroherpetonaceae bacterium]|nr:VOC family protein [Chloroherpetonaceae bacterium]
MKHIILFLVLLANGITLFAQHNNQNPSSSTIKSIKKMKLNAGIITNKLKETKKFYTEVLNFGVTFENDFYLLLHTPENNAEISFLLPNHPSQQPVFHKAFEGAGVYLTIEVESVEAVYKEMKKTKIPIMVELRKEPWGDHHFAIQDPNGINIDIVTYNPPEK